MVKFSKKIRQEIIEKSALRDKSGEKVYDRKMLAKEYNTYLENITAISQGFKSHTDYQKQLAKKRGFESLNDYRKHLAKENGFESLTDYQKHLAKKNLESKVDE